MIKFRAVPTITALLILLFCFQISVTADEDEIASFVSLENLRSSGDDWEVAGLNIKPETGDIRLLHDNWMMYFLHWRELDSTNRDLSVAYTQKHLLNFWGPDMPFTLTSDTGTTTVAGHQAVFVGGTISEGAIETRFIVWNCEKTGRQFTADCNFNRKMGTLREKFEIQFEITSSLCCHDGCTSSDNSNLPRRYSSPDWNLSFNIPPTWRTSPFEAKAWFPDGMSLTRGTLWTLMTDSDKSIELYWSRHEGSISIDKLKNSLNELIIDSLSAKKSPGITSYTIDTVYSAEGRFWAEGTLVWLEDFNGQLSAEDCTFIAALWRKADRDFMMLASLVQVNDIWGFKIDLTPSRETVQRFLNDEIIPGLGCF